MIKTTTEVSYKPSSPDEKAILFSKISSSNRSDENEIYTITIEEWIEITSRVNAPNELGEMEMQDVVSKKTIRTLTRVVSFAESDYICGVLDQMYNITETGASRRKRYTVLGHLLIKNQEDAYKTTWVEV